MNDAAAGKQPEWGQHGEKMRQPKQVLVIPAGCGFRISSRAWLARERRAV
jgi:hypothetical protein